MSAPNLTDEAKKDIQKYLKSHYDFLIDYITSKYRDYLSERLFDYCDANNISIDIEKTVDEFLKHEVKNG